MTEQDKKNVLYWMEEIELEMDDGDFQRDFFESLKDQFEAKSFLSEKQYQSLQKIYERVTA